MGAHTLKYPVRWFFLNVCHASVRNAQSHMRNAQSHLRREGYAMGFATLSSYISSNQIKLNLFATKQMNK